MFSNKTCACTHTCKDEIYRTLVSCHTHMVQSLPPSDNDCNHLIQLLQFPKGNHQRSFSMLLSVSYSDLKELVEKSQDLVLIDVRSEREVARGSIPRSINIPREIFFFSVTSRAKQGNKNVMMLA